MGRFLSYCLFTLSITAYADSEKDFAGVWVIDDHMMVLASDGTFYASGYEPIDDQYGTYEVRGQKMYFIFTMYNAFVESEYWYQDDNGNLLLTDELGHSLEYIKSNRF